MKINSNPQIVYRSNFLDKIYNKFVSTNIIKNELDEEKWEIYNHYFLYLKMNMQILLKKFNIE